MRKRMRACLVGGLPLNSPRLATHLRISEEFGFQRYKYYLTLFFISFPVNVNNECLFSTTVTAEGSCVFPCRCTKGCISDTGACVGGGHCIDDHPSMYKWHGPICQTGECKKTKSVGTFLYDAVSSPQDHSKRFTLYFPDIPVHSDTISASAGSTQPHATINARRLLVYISTTVYSEVLIYLAA